MNEILDKIKILRNSDQYDERFLEDFDRWEQDIQKAWATEKLAEHFVVEKAVKVAEGKIALINKRLCRERSDKLPDKARDLLIIEKGIWEIVVGWFSSTVAKAEIKSITQRVEDEIKDLKQ